MIGLKCKPQNGFKLQQERFQLNIRGTLSSREHKYRQRRLPAGFIVFLLLKVFKNLSDKRLSRMKRDKPDPFLGQWCSLQSHSRSLPSILCKIRLYLQVL